MSDNGDVRSWSLIVVLSATGCGRLLGLEPPTVIDAGADADNADDGAVEASVDAQGDALQSVVLQRGLDGYAGVIDTYISMGSPASEYSLSSSLRWDEARVGLIRFELQGVLPAGAGITSAFLELQLLDGGVLTDLHESNVAWAETVTYEAFMFDPTDVGAKVASRPPGVAGLTQLDVTSSVTTWHADASSNRGWMVIAADSGSGRASSSEDVLARRPRLVVTYR